MTSARLNVLARELNVGVQTIIEYLHKHGYKEDLNPNTKLDEQWCDKLESQFKEDKKEKKKSEEIIQKQKLDKPKKETITIEPKKEEFIETYIDSIQIKSLGKIDLNNLHKKPEPKPEAKPEPKPELKAVEVAPEPKPKPVVEVKEVEVPKIVEVKEEIPIVHKQEKIEIKSDIKETVNQEIEKELVVIPTKEEDVEDSFIRMKVETLEGPNIKGKIDLEQFNKPKVLVKQADRSKLPIKKDFNKKPDFRGNDRNKGFKPEFRTNVPPAPPTKDKDGNIIPTPVSTFSSEDKKKRDRIKSKHVDATQIKDDGKKKIKSHGGPSKFANFGKRLEVNQDDVDKQIKDTFAKLSNKKVQTGAKYRKDRRDLQQQRNQDEIERQQEELKTIKISEFATVSELATMMDVHVNEVITTCMNFGLFVSINQRLDSEALELVADEFGFELEFIKADEQQIIEDVQDSDEDLLPRPPIVTVMGHVDHGKTSLLDYIRKTNVIAGEAGGITQHIGAYNVVLENGHKITFLDTPGHEAFTAMRARGARVTDIAIIIVAADDDIMPQTIEAINHASAAGVQIIFAINKIDKAGADPEKIKQKLAEMNYQVEQWGGKYQSHDISAKAGIGIKELMDKVLLEAEMLNLKANPDKNAKGAILESALDKGRGYITTVLVESGTLKVGDIMLAGCFTGNVKAMFNERNQSVKQAGPSVPVLVLGLNGAPQAGDTFNIMSTDKEARTIASKRMQIQREQGIKTQKHLTLDEIGRRIAVGNFKQINIVVKGDVDGSIEALADSLIKLSNPEIQVNIIHKAVGAISESDVLLASASDAIVIGFQVRPTVNARKIAEKEGVEVRLYSIIYDAIEEVKDAMEGMLSPELKEEIIGNLDILETFNITKVGTVAGCMVKEGKIFNDSKIRIIRDSIVKYEGDLGSLKRFQNDVKEVYIGQDCGLNIKNFNDIKVGDVIEVYTVKEIKKKL